MIKTRLASHHYFSNKQINAISELTGGLNNEVYKVELADCAVVVRLKNSDPEQQTELAVQQVVANMHHAPRVLYHQSGDPLSVFEFIDGTHQPGSDWSPAQLSRFAGQLAAIHQLPTNFTPQLSTTNLLQQINIYQQQLKLNSTEQPLVQAAIARLSDLDHYPPTLGLCHQDLLPQNIICSDNKRWIIDWEFAEQGDVYFDLAGFIIEHQLTTKQSHDFVSTYFSQQNSSLSNILDKTKTKTLYKTSSEAKLTLMKIAYNLICWLWHKVEVAGIAITNETLQQIHQQRQDVYWRGLSAASAVKVPGISM
jgi:thiamine kinase